VKLAHFSDVHITHFPLSGDFALKRLAAVASYSLMGRGRHFVDSDRRIAALLRDVDALQVDHALCTGDLTGVSTTAEFAQVAELFGPRLEQPGRFTCIPGNHDRYVTGVEGLFDRAFGRLCEGGVFPFVKPVQDNVTIVGIDVTRPTGLTDSSGLVGHVQREKLLAVLTDPSLRARFVVVALHYGLLRSDGTRDTRSHGLRDDVELTSLLDRDDVTVDLVLHGHMHRPYVIKTTRRHVVCAGSATDLHVRACGFNVYELDARRFTVEVTRREWNADAAAYQATPGSPLASTFTTR
jgi:3',5'-cyclic AMP phosphodiesterase CpdA